ncbi:MAG: hypothetical protein ACYTCU_05905 [Planctomycetota bacterium]|jgi:hypothetical protein
MDVILESLAATGRQVVIAFVPLALVALLLHGIELALTARMVSRFGWRGVLVTGWLGVPVHELSHAAMCLLFGHRVERVRLFAPDRRTGRLGTVRHAWDRRSLYQQVGRFFIGVAPLAGGGLVLWLLTWALGRAGATPPLAGGAVDLATLPGAVVDQVTALLKHLVQPGQFSRPVTWLYLYLCLCVGAHMAPSGTDLKGGWPGFWLLLGLMLAANLVAGLAGADPGAGEALASAAIAPLLALLGLALALGVLCLALVYVATIPFPRRSP